MKTTPEQEFRSYAVGGDLAALGRVFDRFAPELFAIARKLVPASPAEDAEDLVQATFVTAIEKAAHFDAQRSIGAWLVGILARHAQNAKRRVSRRGPAPSIEGDLGGESVLLGKGPGPATSAERADWLAVIQSAVRGTGATYRPVLEAVLLEGSTPGEAARHLNLAPGTARQRLRRGLAMVRKTLGASPYGGVFALGAAMGFGRRASAMRGRVLDHAANAGTGSGLAAPSTLSEAARLATKPAGSLATKLALALPLTAAGVIAFVALQDNEPSSTTLSLGRETAQDSSASAQLTLPSNAPLRSAVPVAAAAPAPVAVEAPAVAHGRVLVSNTSKDLAGAQIWLRHSSGEREQVATTDAGGRFEFEYDRDEFRRTPAEVQAAQQAQTPVAGDGLPTIEILADGYERFAIADGMTRRARDLSQEMFRATKAGADFGLISLMPAYHIQGQVLNEYGQPAIAELFLLDHIRGDLLHESPLGHTDSQGFFDIQSAGRFFHRSPRSLQLLAVGSGANRGSGSTRNVTGTGFVEIAKRMSADLEPGVLPAPIKNIEITLHQMHLRAQVVDDSGTPLAGVLVEAKAQSDSWSTSMPLLSVPVGRKLWLDALPDSFEQVFRRTTDAWGWVEFDRLPLLDDLGKPAINGYRLNTWILHATLDGFAPETVHSVSTISPDAGPVVTAFKMFQPPTIVLQRPAPIVITGLVLDPTGAPVIGATIEMPWSELATVTDNSGAWSWTLQSADLLPLDLTCSVDGYSTRHWTLTPELIDYDLQARHNFQLEAPIGLSIQVVDLGGQPVDGVMVSVSRTTPRQPEPLIPGTTTTQLGGWTRWTHLPAGQWTIRIGNSRFHNGVEIEPIETTVVIGSEPLERSFQVTLSGKSEADGNPPR